MKVTKTWNNKTGQYEIMKTQKPQKFTMPSMCDSLGYTDIKNQIKGMTDAGERLNFYRRWGYMPEDEIMQYDESNGVNLHEERNIMEQYYQDKNDWWHRLTHKFFGQTINEKRQEKSEQEIRNSKEAAAVQQKMQEAERQAAQLQANLQQQAAQKAGTQPPSAANS